MKLLHFKPRDTRDHEEIMVTLDRWGEQLKSTGDVVALAIVAVHADGSVGCAYEEGGQYFALQGGVNDLSHRMHEDSAEWRDPR